MPDVQIHQSDVVVEQESSVGGLSAERLRQLVEDGLTEAEARARILSGFAAPVIQELPADLAVAVDRLVRA
jgi:Fe-S cluster assembly protein SufB